MTKRFLLLLFAALSVASARAEILIYEGKTPTKVVGTAPAALFPLQKPTVKHFFLVDDATGAFHLISYGRQVGNGLPGYLLLKSGTANVFEFPTAFSGSTGFALTEAQTVPPATSSRNLSLYLRGRDRRIRVESHSHIKRPLLLHGHYTFVQGEPAAADYALEVKMRLFLRERLTRQTNNANETIDEALARVTQFLRDQGFTNLSPL